MAQLAGLEHQLLKLPSEVLAQLTRTEHRAFEKELSETIATLQEASCLDAVGRKAAVGSVQAALADLNGLKRKLSDMRSREAAQTGVCRKRIQHFCEPTTAPRKSEVGNADGHDGDGLVQRGDNRVGSAKVHLRTYRLMADYLYKRGWENSAGSGQEARFCQSHPRSRPPSSPLLPHELKPIPNRIAPPTPCHPIPPIPTQLSRSWPDGVAVLAHPEQVSSQRPWALRSRSASRNYWRRGRFRGRSGHVVPQPYSNGVAGARVRSRGHGQRPHPIACPRQTLPASTPSLPTNSPPRPTLLRWLRNRSKLKKVH